MREEDFDRRYKALVSVWFSDPTCLACSEPTGLDEAARAFGADLAAAEHMSVEDFQVEQHNVDIPGMLPILVARTIGNWTLVVEPNGCEGARPERVNERARQLFGQSAQPNELPVDGTRLEDVVCFGQPQQPDIDCLLEDGHHVQ